MKASKPRRTPDRSARVEVKVQGKLDPHWIQNFQGITTHFDGEVTTLTGNLADQSALRGLLCALWDFNLAVLSVITLEPEGTPGS
jgi:hypothetical protein